MITNCIVSVQQKIKGERTRAIPTIIFPCSSCRFQFFSIPDLVYINIKRQPHKNYINIKHLLKFCQQVAQKPFRWSGGVLSATFLSTSMVIWYLLRLEMRENI
jgi:hypothetical protein